MIEHKKNAEHLIPCRRKDDEGKVFPSGVRVGRTSYGLGVFSFAFIPKGTPVGRVSGKIITEEDYGSDYCISAGDNKVLEPGPPFCYLNHSCEPNCQLMQYVREEEVKDGEELEIGGLSADEMDLDETEYISSDDDECYYSEEAEDGTEEDDDSDESGEETDETLFEEDEDAEIWVETINDIMPGQELTIDYAWPADRAAKCLCGSKSCRGWIVDPKELDDVLKYQQS